MCDNRDVNTVRRYGLSTNLDIAEQSGASKIPFQLEQAVWIDLVTFIKQQLIFDNVFLRDDVQGIHDAPCERPVLLPIIEDVETLDGQ